MSMYIFSHGDHAVCPNCKINLFCVEQNYSGSGEDMAECDECGKTFYVTYKIDKIVEAQQ